jgi:hypothetical protein
VPTSLAIERPSAILNLLNLLRPRSETPPVLTPRPSPAHPVDNGGTHPELGAGVGTTVASHFEPNAPLVTMRPLCAANIGTRITMSNTSLTLTRLNLLKQPATLEAGIRLIYAGSATTSNEQKHRASDYESEGRRFESCRARQRNPGICRGKAK